VLFNALSHARRYFNAFVFASRKTSSAIFIESREEDGGCPSICPFTNAWHGQKLGDSGALEGHCATTEDADLYYLVNDAGA
jgi:hypothetical protein